MMASSDLVESFNNGLGTALHASYAAVHVLLISWAKSDLKDVQREIEDLRVVFEKDYRYTSVTSFPIPIDGLYKLRFNTEITSFIETKSQSNSTLLIFYYAGHCSSKSQGLAEWAAFEKEGPTVQWHVTQQLLFSAPCDVLLILDTCHASLISPGSKDDGGRFELIAASAKGSWTPKPGPRSFTRGLIRLLKQHVEKGIRTNDLASILREDLKITETPVFHEFVRQHPSTIHLQRLQAQTSEEFITKPTGYVLFRASLSDDVTGLQIARWLKTAPPTNVTAVTIEAVVSRARQIQKAFPPGGFPSGSMFEGLSMGAREEILHCIRGLHTVMATAETHAADALSSEQHGESHDIAESLHMIQKVVSDTCTAIETPLLLDLVPSGVHQEGSTLSQLSVTKVDLDLLAANEVDKAFYLKDAVSQDDPCRYSTELIRDNIVFTVPCATSSNTRSHRFTLGTYDGHPVIMETYGYTAADEHSGEPQHQALQQVRKVTGLLCHPKREGFHILPCAGFFRDRLKQTLGLAFRAPPGFDSRDADGVSTLLQLYKEPKLLPLGDRIQVAYALASAVDLFHRVGWVHKSIRSSNVVFLSRKRSNVMVAGEHLGINDDSQRSRAASALDFPVLSEFDLSKPLLFGFEYSRVGDGTTYLDEDYSTKNNLYRVPERWGRPAAPFDKSHDIYALGTVLLEIAQWKSLSAILRIAVDDDEERVVAADVAASLLTKCGKSMCHQVGLAFASAILTCLEFRDRTKGMDAYQAHRYFQTHVTEPLRKAVGQV